MKREERRRLEISSLVKVYDTGIFSVFSLSLIYRNMARYARLVRLSGPQWSCAVSGNFLFFFSFLFFSFSFSSFFLIIIIIIIIFGLQWRDVK
jgi:hypothetical protein